MGNGTYFLNIERDAQDGVNSETYAYVYGDLDAISYIGKRAVKALPETGQLTLKLIETDRLGPDSEDKRTVTEFTGDADIVATVLKKKLASEKARRGEQPVQVADLPTDPSA
jgi:hypothetical protein